MRLPTDFPTSAAGFMASFCRRRASLLLQLGGETKGLGEVAWQSKGTLSLFQLMQAVDDLGAERDAVAGQEDFHFTALEQVNDRGTAFSSFRRSTFFWRMAIAFWTNSSSSISPLATFSSPMT